MDGLAVTVKTRDASSWLITILCGVPEPLPMLNKLDQLEPV